MQQECRTSAIIVAAGSGARIGGGVPKQYRALAGRPVIAHAVAPLAAHPAIGQIVVVIAPGEEDRARAALSPWPSLHFVAGGATRQESVANGLAAVDADRVLVHDAARPFLPPAVIDRLLAALGDAEGAVPALPVADTLARADGALGDTVPRDGLFRVQTPQAFHVGALRDAHARWDGDPATDDAQMVRAAGRRVLTVAGDPMLDKLTDAADVAAAARRLGPDIRTGQGYDVHAFADGDHVMLCGITVPHSHGLAGHSDADVGLHALTDAILGALGDGDIGMHFPPSDPRWKGAASGRFLQHARDLVQARGGRIGHVDVTIIGEAPKVGPHRAAMRAELARLLALDEDRVSVKATTTEGLGFAGRREGLAAQAIATIILE